MGVIRSKIIQGFANKYIDSDDEMSKDQKRHWRFDPLVAIGLGVFVLPLAVTGNTTVPLQSQYCAVTSAAANEGGEALATKASKVIETDKINAHNVGVDIGNFLFKGGIVPQGADVAICTDDTKKTVTALFIPEQTVPDGLYIKFKNTGIFVLANQDATPQS